MRLVINPNSVEKKKICIRPSMDISSLDKIVEDIFVNVERRGELALKEYSYRFDNLNTTKFLVTKDEIQKGIDSVSTDLKSAIDEAYNNVYKFHESQILKEKHIETSKGVTCWQSSVAIGSVGLYIPGGTAPLFSTVLMLGIPAKIAGCEEVILCSPPQKANGKMHAAVLYAARKCGINKIYKLGGAQAVAAMTLGTKTIPSVSKIFGPGNQYVTAAKQKAMRYGVSIDLPAGPSEVLVYTDESGEPKFIAADLLSQAEHGIDSQVVLVSQSEKKARAVINEVEKQTADLPRKDIVNQCLKNSTAVVMSDVDEAYEFINDYAPEHFIIASDHPNQYIPLIINAGSVFLGNYSPESAGDYASGTNHTLPTSGFAKSYSGTNLDAFVKKITFQQITKEGLANLGNTITTMAREEQLEAHARAVELRLENNL